MAKRKPRDIKAEALEQRGCLNPHPEKVTDPLFSESDFFDSRDLVQVKYEMVRRVQIDGQNVSASAAAFGFSRPSFYQAQSLMESGGLAALAPRKPGPRHAHKLDAEVMDFLEQLRSEDSSLKVEELARRIAGRFGRKVHPRSIERALTRQEKKTALTGPGNAMLSAAYEQLRRQALTALPGGGRFGLAVLLRQGVAAWIEHCTANPLPALTTALDTVPCSAIAPPLHAGIAQILASIALNRIQEVHS